MEISFGPSLMRKSDKGPALPGRSQALPREPPEALTPPPLQSAPAALSASHFKVRPFTGLGGPSPGCRLHGGAQPCSAQVPGTGTQQVHSRHPGRRGEGDSPVRGGFCGWE